MSRWYIGIDEHGRFNPINPDDDSYVCAVITQATNKKLKDVFESVYGLVDPTLAKDEDGLREYFHGMKLTPPIREMMLRGIWRDTPDLIKKIVISSNRPYVVSNPQQWWIMALQSVLAYIFESGFFANDDDVCIHIGTRALEVIGFYLPKDVVAVKGNDDKYLKKHTDYHKFLGEEIERWLHSLYPMVGNVKCMSAKKSYLVTLADQATNMAFTCYKDMIPEGILEKVPCRSFLPDENVEEQIGLGDYTDAMSSFVDLYFAKRKEDALPQLTSILQKKDEPQFAFTRFDVWQTIIEACKTAIENRGVDGACVQRADKVIGILKNYTENIPTALVPRYNEMLSSFLAHSGASDRQAFESMEDLLRESTSFPAVYEQWKSFVDLQLSKSQVLFNSYDFEVPFMWKIHKAYGEILNSMRDTLGLKADFVDDTYAAIVGTIAQSEAFLGNHASSIQMLEDDYRHTSDKWKSQVASFLVVEYWHREDWGNCLKWFAEQTRKSFEEFGNTFNQRTNLWLVLNYLRIYALGLKLGRDDLPAFPAEDERWKREGDYPFALIEKWVGICNLLKAKMDRSISAAERRHLQSTGLHLLKQAAGCLENSREMVLKSLALPILKIGYALGDYDESDKSYRKYTQLMERCKKTPAFAQFIKGKEQFDLPDGLNKVDVWETARMLPFNYS